MGEYHRRGQAQTYPAQELGRLMAIPVLNILYGTASPSFPGTDRAAPAPFVHVSLGVPPVEASHRSHFPVTVNWRQWRNVIAPLLEDPVVSNYVGSLGGMTGDGALTAESVGVGLFECFTIPEIISWLETEIERRASNAGY